jgi:glucokinase
MMSSLDDTSECRAEVLAIDIGGTKIATALVAADGSIRRRQVIVTAAHTSADDLAARLLDVVSGYDLAAIAGIGVGTAGPIDYRRGVVSPVNIPAWRDFPLRRCIEHSTGLPVRLAGDAVCGAVAERAIGAAQASEWAIFMVLSTGVGGGYIADGKVLAGRLGNAGLVGHMVVHPGGERCACGQLGCLEVYASGPSLVRRARAIGWVGDHPAELLAACRAGDALAAQVVETAADAVALAIAQAAASLEIELAVLGGGVMRSHDVMLPAVRNAVARRMRDGVVSPVNVVGAHHSDDACLIGAGLIVHRPDLLTLSSRNNAAEL